jgi:hypothetical protein
MLEYFGRFAFRYCQDVDNPGKVRIYIQHQPDYQGRSTESQHTHRLGLFSGNNAPPHICIKDHCLPKDLGEAQELAHRWARATENYIRTGRFQE